jgi:hypothetical protein
MIKIKSYPGIDMPVDPVVCCCIQGNNKTQVIAEKEIIRIGNGIVYFGNQGGTDAKPE